MIDKTVDRDLGPNGPKVGPRGTKGGEIDREEISGRGVGGRGVVGGCNRHLVSLRQLGGFKMSALSINQNNNKKILSQAQPNRI